MSQEKYTKGEIVWAKIRGFPWWPGSVVAKLYESKNDPENSEILINFIGENSHARLPYDKVAKFQKNYDEFTKDIKKKKLIESIETAKSLQQILIQEYNNDSKINEMKSDNVKVTNKKEIKYRKKRNRLLKINDQQNSDVEQDENTTSEEDDKKKINLQYYYGELGIERITRSKISNNQNLKEFIRETSIALNISKKQQKRVSNKIFSEENSVNVVNPEDLQTIQNMQHDLMTSVQNIESCVNKGLDSQINQIQSYLKIFNKILATILQQNNDKIIQNIFKNKWGQYIKKVIYVIKSNDKNMNFNKINEFKELLQIDHQYLGLIVKHYYANKSLDMNSVIGVKPSKQEENVQKFPQQFEDKQRSKKKEKIQEQIDFDQKSMSQNDVDNHQNKTEIENKQMRKKICQKLAKILQQQSIDKIKAQQITLQLEQSIRKINPDMKSEYKEKIQIILKLAKVNPQEIQKIYEDQQFDFDQLSIFDIQQKKINTPQTHFL